jgi:Domain of unknown function (DUF4145)
MPKILHIAWRDSKDQSSAEVDRIPDTCPLCKHAIEPLQIWAFCDTTKDNLRDKYYGQVVYRCPRGSCQKLFIAYFKAPRSQFYWDLVESQPSTKQEQAFHEIITKLSPSFKEIYNEAYAAEQYSLSQICGAGYRKALEFLIKDYLIELNPESAESIKLKQLGNCIKDDVSNNNIKDVAKRAAWLGNDETHYIRKWDEKDLSDLKRLIKLVVDWIEMEKLTSEAIRDMPESN